jgi:hypothetical protein
MDGVSISVEIAPGTDCPANRPLLYQVDRTMEHRPRQEGLSGQRACTLFTVPLCHCPGVCPSLTTYHITA